jgi:hypothetical protein
LAREGSHHPRCLAELWWINLPEKVSHPRHQRHRVIGNLYLARLGLAEFGFAKEQLHRCILAGPRQL